jgi:hypothetical protein
MDDIRFEDPLLGLPPTLKRRVEDGEVLCSRCGERIERGPNLRVAMKFTADHRLEWIVHWQCPGAGSNYVGK